MFFKWDKERSDGKKHYDVQSELIKKALEKNNLEELLKLMREDGEESAIYLCGTRIDNVFCFGSNDIGIVISVLPQDGQKASVPSHHPASTEVYIIIQGELTFESILNNVFKQENIYQNSIRVIPPGECHRIRKNENCNASSLIIKTNLKHKPGVVRCDKCEYYKNPADCLLNINWKEES